MSGYVTDKTLSVCADMFGCPNRCLHCWLGHSPNVRMEDGADEYIVGKFSPYCEKIEFYSWLREPDFCDGYKKRWEKDLALSKNARPERFGLASFWRIVRDEDYVPWLKTLGVKKVQLTLFGLEKTTDRYVGRRGAYGEILKATDIMIKNGVTPRWQCFINEENKDEIVKIYGLARKMRETVCPELEFFVHEGSCDGENRKLYPIRINKRDIPEELIPVYFGYGDLLTERECCLALENDGSQPYFHNGDGIVIYISNEYDVFFNFTNMSDPWKIGNLVSTPADELVRMIVCEDTPALRLAKKTSWSRLAETFGDKSSERAFSLDDYKIFLFNKYLDSEAAGGKKEE
ncbi:MAG: radical SAM protein [Clostridia bacterium]|nr:radical SAM protein [Clostridia bacterium]